MYFRGALYLNKLESPSSKNALCQVWLKLAQWFRRRRWNCKKFTTTTRTTTTTTDNGHILIRKAHLSLRLRWAKNTIRIVSNSPTNDPCKRGENKTGTNPCMQYVVWSLSYAIVIFSWNNNLKCYLCSVLACAFAKFRERTRVETAPIIFV